MRPQQKPVLGKTPAALAKPAEDQQALHHPARGFKVRIARTNSFPPPIHPLQKQGTQQVLLQMHFCRISPRPHLELHTHPVRRIHQIEPDHRRITSRRLNGHHHRKPPLIRLPKKTEQLALDVLRKTRRPCAQLGVLTVNQDLG